MLAFFVKRIEGLCPICRFAAVDFEKIMEAILKCKEKR